MDEAPVPALATVTIADDPDTWREAGFAFDDGRCAVGAAELVFEQPDGRRGLIGVQINGLGEGDCDGLPFEAAAQATRPDAGEHPNGILALDHLVVFSPDLDRTITALGEAGLELRRVREEPTPAGAPRQAFFRTGETILEVVQEPDDVVAERGRERPAKLWGMAFAVRDMDVAVALLGPRLGAPRPAVQAGRTIATLTRDAALAVPVALITVRER
jgi:hypothetical protein